MINSNYYAGKALIICSIQSMELIKVFPSSIIISKNTINYYGNFVQVIGSGVIEFSNETNPGTHCYNKR